MRYFKITTTRRSDTGTGRKSKIVDYAAAETPESVLAQAASALEDRRVAEVKVETLSQFAYVRATRSD